MFYGQPLDGMRVDELLFTKYFSDRKNGFFIECGAGDGINDSSCKFFEESLGWTGINIEPFDYTFDMLSKNRKDSFKNINIALSDKADTVKFITTYDTFLGCGSIGGNDYLVNCLGGNRNKLIEKVIKTTTYKNIIEENNVTHVDLFVLDVEGHEVNVIKGMKDCNVLPDFIYAEYGLAGLNNISSELNKYGYVIDFKDSYNAMFIKKL